MVKNTKTVEPAVEDDPIFAEPSAEDTAAAEQAEADAKQAKADAEIAKIDEEAAAKKAPITQGNGPELIALRTIVGVGGKDKVIYPNQGPRSLFRCLDPKERKRLLDMGAAMEQDKNDDSRIIVPR